MKLYPSPWFYLALSTLLGPASMIARNQHTTPLGNSEDLPEQRTATRSYPCSQKSERRAIENLPKIARFWLTEDVGYLISPEERCAFLLLRTNQEREQFIEQFWLRRAPDPTSFDNTFKRKHYERIVFADEKYGGRVPGWKADRGQVYIRFGPPDSIESRPAGEKAAIPPKGAIETDQYSAEIWHYKHLEGLADNFQFKFVDPNGSGDYRLVDHSQTTVSSHNSGGQPCPLAISPDSHPSIEICVGPAPTPVVQFKDLEAVVVSRIIRKQVPFSYRIEFARATHATTFAKIIIVVPQNQQISGSSEATAPKEFKVFGRVTKPTRWVVDTFERRVSFVGKRNAGDSASDCQFEIAIVPGTYRLEIAVKDVRNGEVGALHTAMDVPSYDEINRRK